MQSNNNVMWAAVLVVTLVGGYWLFSSSAEDEAVSMEAKVTTETKKIMDDGMMEEEKMDDDMMSDEAMMDDEEMSDDMMKVGSYEAYAPEKLARANEGDVVLFFKASWCPSCRSLENDIEANLTNIPSGVTILEINYDTATELKAKYGVTSQHTLVQVDAAGEAITSWTGSPSLEALVAKIQ